MVCVFNFAILSSVPGHRERRICSDGTRSGRRGTEGNPGACQDLAGHIHPSRSQPCCAWGTGVSYLLRSEPTLAEGYLVSLLLAVSSFSALKAQPGCILATARKRGHGEASYLSKEKENFLKKSSFVHVFPNLNV